jgi:large conductance mechanosensitive channel
MGALIHGPFNGLLPPDGVHHQEGSRGTDMSFASEFKAFALKGNVIDLAVGVIIGAAFGKIVDSMINDLIMPVVGRIFGGFDFTNYFFAMKEVPAGTPMTLEAVKKAGVPVFAYGSFITVAINFLVLAFIIFMMVKQFNRMKREAPPAAVGPVAPPEEVVLLRQIRDALKR